MRDTQMQTTRLLLVRHGESTANAQRVFSGWSTEVVLTELGRRQASQTGAELRRYARIDALYASS
ncbi:MAG TPA: phosphoglycerate mutase family protein, partial [Nitrolancea sp.]|nr:phosphoglycerate mutase family protein [Nitrolancea sp.]